MMPADARMPRRVRIVEVGPRDGLQNEPDAIPTDVKLAFIRALADAGIADIEATSFVHPKAVPQLADAAEVVAGLPDSSGVTYSALAPNEKGLERAIRSGVKRVAVFTAASESFTQKNINMTIAESLAVYERMLPVAHDAGVTVRGYVSTCFVCPYEGDVPPQRVLEVARALFDLGVDEVAVSDTIGAAAPTDVCRMLDLLLAEHDAAKLALHFHDTYATALANVCAALPYGIATFDASAGGLGGCPYAPGASGNLATEDLVYLLDRMGIESGVDLAGVAQASRIVADFLGRKLPSRQLARLDACRAT